MANPGDLVAQLAGAANAVHADRDQNTREGLYQGFLNQARANPDYGPDASAAAPYRQAAALALTARRRDEHGGTRPSSPELRDVEHGLVAQSMPYPKTFSAVTAPLYSLMKALMPSTDPALSPPSAEELKWGMRPWWAND